MKKLEEFINNKYISLDGIDEEYISNIQNLNGMQITECCGCCGCCCEPCSCGDGCCSNDPYSGPATTISFYSEKDIVEKLKTQPEVMDIYNIRHQFANNRFFFDQIEIGPLIFREQLMLQSGEQLQGDEIIGNLKLKEIINKSELSDVIILIRLDNSIQVFGLKHTGTNGKEGSIKNSLIEISKKLTSLEKIPEVDWAQVLNVSIDNADDVYTFLMTFTLKASSLPVNPTPEDTPQPINIGSNPAPIRSLKSFIK